MVKVISLTILTLLALIAVVVLGAFFPIVLTISLIILSLVGVGIIATSLYFIFTPLN